jgi:methylmalonyl-CoA/ethylmalonyl-CoA epimerase
MATPLTATSDRTLSNSFLTDTMQICLVTRDIRRTMDGMARLGIGPWAIYTFDPTTVRDMTFRGRPAEYSMKLALTFNGNMMWEIIQPLTGPSIYTEFLDRHGEGIHHTAFHCGSMGWEERVAEFERRGFAMIQSGLWQGIVPYAYFDTEAATGTAFELFIIPEGVTMPAPEEWYPAPPPGA